MFKNENFENIAVTDSKQSTFKLSCEKNFIFKKLNNVNVLV